MVYPARDNGRTSNDRISKSYRSPPLSTRVSSSNTRYEEHRSRRDDDVPISCLSKFYRERFGSHSPEDYLNLRISSFDKSLSKEDIRSTLQHEFKALAPFEIKIVLNTPDSDERLAYVNFERPECAKIVRRNMVPRLQKVLGRKIALDPAGVIRDQEGKFIPDRYNRAAMAAAVDRTRSPNRSNQRRRSPNAMSGTNNSSQGYAVVNPNALNGIATALPAGGKRRDVHFTNLNQDDTQASRTIFVGNLPGDVRETELKRIFEMYGTIDNIDIKILQDSNAAFAFILYKTVEEAIEAKNFQHNKPIRPGSSKCQIGYGKSQASQRLYVGGLGSWATYNLLMSEFDRYGSIDVIEYTDGDSCAYIRYEDLESATDACARMKNFDLDGKGKHITIDFAKDDKKGRKRCRSGSDDEYDSKRRGPRTPSLSPGRSPTEAGYIETLDELRDQVASTWRGIISLKKCDYPLGVYRVFGKEHLIQDMMRDEEGNSLKLNITQRLPLDNAYYQRMIDLNKNELALMIAVETNEHRPAEQLVKYLQEKNAVGVTNIRGGSVHVLAYSPTAEHLLRFFSPRIALLKAECNYLLIALKKNIIQTPKAQFLPPNPSELPPPPPLPSLGSFTTLKREPEEEKMPLREDRSMIQLQLKIKQEINTENSSSFNSSTSLISGAPPPPPIPPNLSPPSKENITAETDRQSSSEGENDHRRHRRHRKDDEEEEEEESEYESEDEEDNSHRRNANGKRYVQMNNDDNQENEVDEESENDDNSSNNDNGVNKDED